jgi:alkanesulfonate monooxygenase SsuD/methylene tetrahydromethanopterin reductase-like flavin-dependent oxidoreductase (luciferase family)
MRFGVFYEQQLPKPWLAGDEQRLFNEALDQIALADRLGVDFVWAAEHHFLDEYSHSSASDLLLAAAAARTSHIRIGLGIRQVIANYNHPARTAEAISTLDLISNGRVEFGIGEGATRMELDGFRIPIDEKRAMSLEAAEQIANMMVMDPYPGFTGKSFSMPCRNVLPKPAQKPHPPMWMACTNRETIRIAARNGLGVLAFTFTDAEEAQHWAKIYYDTIKSEECVPLGHRVNANIAMMSAFSLHEDEDEAVARGQLNFEFFGYAMAKLVREDTVPGRGNLWERFLKERETERAYIAEGTLGGSLQRSAGIGTPQSFIAHVRAFQESGVDQVIFLQQAGRMRHEDIRHSLQLFARDVLPVFADGREAREAEKAEELAPYIAAAMARKSRMPSLADDEIPVVKASKPPLPPAPAGPADLAQASGGAR